ncbi:MAG: SDR family NAD(P)-dependent oxidoreductase [Planctomycetota bacterium]
MTSLQERSVLVTGASSGIGAACVRAFAAAGASVAFCARRREPLESMAAGLSRQGAKVHAFPLDVREFPAVESALAALPAPFSAIDVLVNNAGLARGLETVQEGNLSDWEEMIDTNVKGLLYISRAVLPGMVARGRGHVINVGSIAGHEVYPRGAVYCATKHAVDALTKGMRLDLCGTGVKVSTVDPGLVDTGFSTVRFHGDEEKARRAYRGMAPLQGADIAEVVVWMASRRAGVNVAQTLVLPADQASAAVVHREG